MMDNIKKVFIVECTFYHFKRYSRPIHKCSRVWCNWPCRYITRFIFYWMSPNFWLLVNLWKMLHHFLTLKIKLHSNCICCIPRQPQNMVLCICQLSNILLGWCFDRKSRKSHRLGPDTTWLVPIYVNDV